MDNAKLKHAFLVQIADQMHVIQLLVFAQQPAPLLLAVQLNSLAMKPVANV